MAKPTQPINDSAWRVNACNHSPWRELAGQAWLTQTTPQPQISQ